MYTFAQPLGRAFSTAAGSTAVVCQDRRRTYAELGSRCRRLAGAMRKLGLAPHDRVGVVALNSDRYLELYLGLPAAGFVLVPVNSRLAPAEMRAILADAGVSVLFADADYPGAAGVSHVLRMPDDYEDLIATADELPLGDEVTEDDLAALFYTSGTTGAAKGAMHTHRSLVSSALHFMATWPFDRQTRWLVASPMFHTGGIIATLATVWAGGTHVIMPRFDPDLAVDLIEREAVTHTLLVPTMPAAAAGAQLAWPRNVSSLRYLSHGASPTQVSGG
jgi:long-chain acyl-CoA synthetase